MKILRFFVISMLVTCSAALGNAATIIESRDGQGSTHEMWLEGDKVRINISNASNFMLFDAGTGKMYSVNPDEKQVLDLSSSARGNSPDAAAGKYQARFEQVGKGPDIAGYATEEYQLVVNGRKCSTEFLSKGALRNFKSLDVFESLSNIAKSAAAGLGIGMMDPCDAAKIRFDKTYPIFGYPMRINDRNGVLESEITGIAKNRAVPAGWFELPAGYEVVDINGMMHQGMPGNFSGQGGGMVNPDESFMGGEIDQEKLQQMMEEMMQQMGRKK